MNKRSLCNTCFYAFTREWEKEDDSETIYSKADCTLYPIKNITEIIITKCNKFDEKKRTQKEFEELKKEEEE